MLHDRLVCGYRDQHLQCKLLAEPNLNFEKAFKIAKAMETAERETKDLHKTPAAPVNSMKGTPTGKNFSHRAANHSQRRATPTTVIIVAQNTRLQNANLKMQNATFVKRKAI